MSEIDVMGDARLDKWWRWLWHHIAPEIHTLHLQRLVWQESQQVIRSKHALPGSYWWEYLSDTYAVTQAVAIRRQVERRKGVISLARLVLEMTEDAGRLSREFFLSRFGNDENKIVWAERFWAEQYSGKIGDHLDPAIPSADLKQLDATAGNIKAFVDKHLAHRDASPLRPERMPKFVDLDPAIDTMGAVYSRYFGLITGVAEPTLVPKFDHDWKAVFYQQWAQRP